jgi:hypothetical protein
MVGTRNTWIILHGEALCPVKGSVLYAQGACSRRYKLRSREGAGPRSLEVVVVFVV